MYLRMILISFGLARPKLRIIFQSNSDMQMSYQHQVNNQHAFRNRNLRSTFHFSLIIDPPPTQKDQVPGANII